MLRSIQANFLTKTSGKKARVRKKEKASIERSGAEGKAAGRALRGKKALKRGDFNF